MDYQIKRDKEMERNYIPLGCNWEVQTKGKGSTFRIAFRDERIPVVEPILQSFLETMAMDVNVQLIMMSNALQKIIDCKKEDLAEYVKEVDTIACRTIAWIECFERP